MRKLRQFFDSPFWEIFKEKPIENSLSFLLTLVLNTLAALSEGVSFGLILLAFTALNGDLVAKLEKYPQLHSFFQGNISSQQLFTFLIIAAIVCQILRSGLCYLGQICITQMSIRFQTSMEKRIYNQIFALAFAYIHRYKPGDLVEAVQTPGKIHSILDAVNRMLVCLFNMLALVILLFVISFSMTAILLCLFVLIYAVQRVIFKSISAKSSSLTKELADFNHYTFQCLNGLKTIFTFNRQNYIHAAVEKKAEMIGRMSGRLFLLQFALGPLNEALGILTVGVCVILAPFFLMGAKEVVLPSLLTFVTVAYRLATKLQAGIGSLGLLSYYSGSFAHLKAFLERKGKPFAKRQGSVFVEMKEKLEFYNVSLKYEGNEACSVSDLSFELSKGKFLALVGSSGAGKSTIADLLIGLYAPKSGQILVDGVDLTVYDPGSWKDCLGVVIQDPFLLNSTVEENIRFGCVDRSRECVIAAARNAHAHEFIEKLPLGYETVLGSSGYQLSGGEKQRISLARALIRNPQILILDEATSHLDSYSEKVIQETISSLRHKMTLVVIAHRLSSVVEADEILVLDQGRIVERGLHSDLVASGKMYSRFWKLLQKNSIEQEEVDNVRN